MTSLFEARAYSLCRELAIVTAALSVPSRVRDLSWLYVRMGFSYPEIYWKLEFEGSQIVQSGEPTTMTSPRVFVSLLKWLALALLTVSHSTSREYRLY